MHFDWSQLDFTKFPHKWDKFTLFTSAIGGFVARFTYGLDLNDIYLITAIVAQAFAICNILVYLLLNYRRILLNLKRLFTFRKKKK